VRGQIADEIAAVDAEPLLLVETEPAAGSTLVTGPVVIEVRGCTRPGAVVKVGGRAVEVRADGSFASLAWASGRRSEIAIQATRDGRSKTTTRRFRMRGAD